MIGRLPNVPVTSGSSRRVLWTLNNLFVDHGPGCNGRWFRMRFTSTTRQSTLDDWKDFGWLVGEFVNVAGTRCTDGVCVGRV
jgi:hypothetical protein